MGGGKQGPRRNSICTSRRASEQCRVEVREENIRIKSIVASSEAERNEEGKSSFRVLSGGEGIVKRPKQEQ